MPQRRFTEEQIIKMLREVELTGGQVRELCRKYGIAEQTFYRWRQKYGGLEGAEAARLRQRERENARLKKLVAERDLEVEVMKDLLLSVARSSLSYQPRRGTRDMALLALIQQLAQQRPRYESRRIWALLQRQEVHVNPKRIDRLWRAHGLTLHARPRRQRPRAPIPRLPEATRPHEMWAYDVVHDRCANGAALTCLAVVDEDTRLCLAIEVGSRIDSQQVLNVLTRLLHRYGVPSYMRSDHGPEFIAKAIRDWLAAQGLETASIEPGNPWQNGAVASFIGTFRDECWHTEWFLNRTEARIIIENYRREYNEERPHSSLAYRTPAEVCAEAMILSAAKIHEDAGEPHMSTGLTLPMVQ